MKNFLITLFSFFIITQIIQAYAAAPSAEIWEKVSPYLLPDDHPAKETLDRIFSSSRVILSLKSMKKAGFENPEPRKFTHLIVTRHPELKGYIIKTYLDAQRYPKNKPEHYFWLLRIKGAETIRSAIEAYGWQDQFKVPKKWIYALPKHPSPPDDYLRKYFIIVEEDMSLRSHASNLRKWKKVQPEFLEKIFILLEATGLHDCAKPDNIPFAKDGRIAFIDTQTHHEWPVAYEKLKPFLSDENSHFWKKTIQGCRQK